MSKIIVVSATTLLAELEAGSLQETIITHDGCRHVDETIAIARFVAGTPGSVRVCFTRDPRILGVDHPNLTFVDVGGRYEEVARRFDHHFKPVPARADGLPFSSFGLMSPEDEQDHPLVRHVDAIDNGVKGEPAPAWWPCFNPADPNGGSVAWAVHHANPSNLDGSAVTDEQFEQRAVELIELFTNLFGWDGTILPDDDCKSAIENGIARQLSVWHADNHAARLASAERVTAALQHLYYAGVHKTDRVLVLPSFEPAALEVLAAQPENGPLYLVFPGPGGRQWMCQQVATKPGSFEGRKPLPEAWAGLRDVEFAEATGVEDGVFCHPGRFICGASSSEGAMRLARMAVEA